MGDTIELPRYFERVGYAGAREPTLEVLHALTAAHTMSIPFESADPVRGRAVDIAPQALYRKLVLARRGGYCFEQNGLFLEVLRRLGFRVRPLRAGVRLARPDRHEPVGHTHLVLEVMVDGETWITDVGVGSTSLTRALRRVDGVEQATSHDVRRLVRADGRWFHQVRRDGDWVDVYEFGDVVMAMPDRVIANWYTSTHPDSVFRRHLVAARALPHGRRVSLDDRQLIVRGADGRADKKTLRGARELLMALHEHFGIELPPDTRFDLPPLGAA